MAGTAVFAHVTTAHFGYNWLPASPAELACDIIALCMTGIAIHIYIGPKGK